MLSEHHFLSGSISVSFRDIWNAAGIVSSMKSELNHQSYYVLYLQSRHMTNDEYLGFYKF